ncbi:Uncharacterized protein ACO02O_06339 [Dirofilaria immitis]
MICPDGFAGNELNNLLHELGYDTLSQVCPPDNFFFSYICCDHFECCVRFELWFIILAIIILISLSFCCFCCLFAGVLYARRKVEK